MCVSWGAFFSFPDSEVIFYLPKRYNKLTKDKKQNWHTFPWQDLHWNWAENSDCKSALPGPDSCCYWLTIENIKQGWWGWNEQDIWFRKKVKNLTRKQTPQILTYPAVKQIQLEDMFVCGSLTYLFISRFIYFCPPFPTLFLLLQQVAVVTPVKMWD